MAGRMLRNFPLVFLLTGCTASNPLDGGPDDAPMLSDAGPVEGVVCGPVRCTPTQVCVEECAGIDAGPLPSHCIEVPPACTGSTSCDCFGADPCPAGECVSVENGVPLCLCA